MSLTWCNYTGNEETNLVHGHGLSKTNHVVLTKDKFSFDKNKSVGLMKFQIVYNYYHWS